MNTKRPINLDLTTIKFPITAIVSILHRISGIILFLLLPVIIYYLQGSLVSPAAFRQVYVAFSNGYVKVIFWAFGSALIFHLLAGIRHLLMDTGLGEHLAASRQSAFVVMGAAIIFIILLGIGLW